MIFEKRKIRNNPEDCGTFSNSIKEIKIKGKGNKK